MGGEELEKVGAEIFESSGKSAESPSAHMSKSSSPAPPEPENGSTNNLEHGPSNPSSTAPVPDSFDGRINKAWLKHNAAFLKEGTPAPAPMSGSFDDRITSTWDKHYN